MPTLKPRRRPKIIRVSASSAAALIACSAAVPISDDNGVVSEEAGEPAAASASAPTVGADAVPDGVVSASTSKRGQGEMVGLKRGPKPATPEMQALMKARREEKNRIAMRARRAEKKRAKLEHAFPEPNSAVARAGYGSISQGVVDQKRASLGGGAAKARGEIAEGFALCAMANSDIEPVGLPDGSFVSMAATASTRTISSIAPPPLQGSQRDIRSSPPNNAANNGVMAPPEKQRCKWPQGCGKYQNHDYSFRGFTNYYCAGHFSEFARRTAAEAKVRGVLKKAQMKEEFIRLVQGDIAEMVKKEPRMGPDLITSHAYVLLANKMCSM